MFLLLNLLIAQIILLLNKTKWILPKANLLIYMFTTYVCKTETEIASLASSCYLL